MADAPTTHPSLLARLRDHRDREAWERFVELYAPVVYGFGRKHGLQDADAADLTQTVLRAVATAVGRLDYDPARGTFRGWLFTIARNQLRNWRNRPGGLRQASGDDATRRLLEAQPAPQDEAAEWDLACERQLFAWAAAKVRRRCQPATWRAFWQTAVEGRTGKEVAAELGITIAAVYLARSRVVARLREVLREAQES